MTKQKCVANKKIQDLSYTESTIFVAYLMPFIGHGFNLKDVFRNGIDTNDICICISSQIIQLLLM